jgi:Immunoglobulin domain
MKLILKFFRVILILIKLFDAIVDCSAQSIYSNPYIISNISGPSFTLQNQSIQDNYSSKMSGIVTYSGNLFIADGDNNVIREILPNGSVITVAGTVGLSGNIDGPSKSALFGTLKGLAVDSYGNLYTSDISNNTIRKLTLNSGAWSVSTIVKNTSGLNQPLALALDSTGNLYIADTCNFVIRKLTPVGNLSILAGAIGKSGGQDGQGSQATFAYPTGLICDNENNIFVTDFGGNTIRKITSSGLVTTYAGVFGKPGVIDGLLNTNDGQFNHPVAISIDTNENLYIVDGPYGTEIRQITKNGTVSTLAGSPNQVGQLNGTGLSASFNYIAGITVDAKSNIYLTDSSNNLIREGSPIGPMNTDLPPAITIQPNNAYSTGLNPVYISVSATGSSPLSYKWFLNGTAIEDSNNFSGTSTSTIQITNAQSSIAGSYYVVVTNPYGSVKSASGILTLLPISPSLSQQPLSQNLNIGSTATFSVSASGTSPLSFQWYKNGVAISGATDATYSIPSVNPTDAGNYTVIVSNGTGSIISNTALLTVLGSPGRLINLSVLSMDGPGSQLLTIGFTSGGTGTKGTQSLLIRGIGPQLKAYNVSNPIQDPTISLFSKNTLIGSNDNWGTPLINSTAVIAADATTGAFALTDTSSLDSAMVTTLEPGGYTVQIASKNGDIGNVLAEVYDANLDSSYSITNTRLINLSCLESIAHGSKLSAGFVIGGATSEKVLIRVSGPTLAAFPFNIVGTIPDPKLTVFDSSSRILAINTGWAGDESITAANTATGAFQFTNSTSKDSAVILNLEPGAYTIEAASMSNLSGILLIEVYELN